MNSGTAAVHAFILVNTYGFQYTEEIIDDPYLLGDFDIEAIWAILVAGWLMSIPLLGGSSTLRNLRARRIVIYWTGLIGVGIICVAIKRGTHYTHHSHYTPYWASAVAICSGTYQQKIHVLKEAGALILQSARLWSTHNCTSQCGALSPNLILRAGTQMVSMYQPEFPSAEIPFINLLRNRDRKISLGIFIPGVILEVLYAFISGGRNPREARDSLCVFLSGKKQSRFQLLRSYLAGFAGFWVYVFGGLSLIISPFLFVINCFYNEMGLLNLPQDEPQLTIGQWSPCVSTALIISAALISKYGDTWHHAVRRFGCRINPWRRFNHHQNPSTSRPFHPNNNRGKSLARYIFLLFKRFPPIFHSLTKSLAYEARDFRTWILDPINKSSSNLSGNPIDHQPSFNMPSPWDQHCCSDHLENPFHPERSFLADP